MGPIKVAVLMLDLVDSPWREVGGPEDGATGLKDKELLGVGSGCRDSRTACSRRHKRRFPSYSILGAAGLWQREQI